MGKYLQIVECSVYKELNDVLGLKVLSVVNMFSYYCEKKIVTNGISKIIIFLLEENTLEDDFHIDKPSDDLLYIKKNIGNIKYQIDEVKDLVTLRKLLMVEVLDCLHFACKQFNWKFSEYDAIYKSMEKHDFIFNEFYFRKKISANKLELGIYFEFTDSIHLYFAILDNNALSKKILITILPPGLGALYSIQKKIQVIDDGSFKIELSNKRDYWIIDTNRDKVEFHNPKADAGDAHSQYDLGMMYLTGKWVLQDKERAMFWIKKSASQNFSRALHELKKNQHS